MADEQPIDASAPKRKVPNAPRGLQAEGKRLWKQIWATYDLNPGESAILEAACRARDEIAVLRGELGTSSRIVAGSMGQPVINPLSLEIRALEDQAAKLVSSLKLPDDPGSTGAAAPTNQARDAVNSRWARRGQGG